MSKLQISQSWELQVLESQLSSIGMPTHSGYHAQLPYMVQLSWYRGPSLTKPRCYDAHPTRFPAYVYCQRYIEQVFIDTRGL